MMRPSSPAPWYAVVIVLLVAVSLTLAALVLSQRAIERSAESERSAREAAESQWCITIRLQDDAYREFPPPSETGKKLASGYAHLRKTRCPG